MRKAVALILVVFLVVPLVSACLAVFSFGPWVLDRRFYLELVADERLYRVLLDYEGWDHEPGWNESLRRELEALPGFDQVPADALLEALRQVLTPAYLRSQALKLVNDAFEAVEGRSAAFEPYLDLVPLKQQLLGVDGRRFALALAAALRPCSAGQEPAVPGAPLYRCRPAGLSVEATAEVLHQGLPEFLAGLPDQYPLGPWHPEAVPLYYGPQDEFWFALVGARRLVWFGVILGIVAAGFWVGAAFVGGANRREVVQWLGWPLVAPAVLMLISGLALRLVPRWIRLPREMNLVFAGDHRYSQELVEAILSVMRAAADTISRGFLVSGGVTIGIAVGLIVWASSIPVDEQPA